MLCPDFFKIILKFPRSVMCNMFLFLDSKLGTAMNPYSVKYDKEKTIKNFCILVRNPGESGIELRKFLKFNSIYSCLKYF